MSLKNILASLALIATVGAAAQQPPVALPRLNIDARGAAVSGVSSGAYMAMQLHVAHSSRFGAGVGSVAGGPYDCAQGQVALALTRCLGNGEIPVEALVTATRKAAADGAIDALEHLARARVYVFSGAKDTAVKETTGAALVAYYRALAPDAAVEYKKDIPAGHGFVTDSGDGMCGAMAAPFLNNCGFDLAGAILGHLHGTLRPRRDGGLRGELIEFDQTAFSRTAGLGASGYVFVPPRCRDGEKCRLHVALHGCRQNAAAVGDAFASRAGYNRWAEANDIVVLYPQTGATAVNGCWDWWGYGSADHARRSAPQMAAIVAMVERLSAGAAPR